MTQQMQYYTSNNKNNFSGKFYEDGLPIGNEFFEGFQFDIWAEEFEAGRCFAEIYWSQGEIDTFCHTLGLVGGEQAIDDFMRWLYEQPHGCKQMSAEQGDNFGYVYKFQPSWELVNKFKAERGEVNKLPDSTEYVVFRNDEHGNIFYLAHNGVFVSSFDDAQQMTKSDCFLHIDSLPTPDFHGVAFVGVGYPLFVWPSMEMLKRNDLRAKGVIK